MLVAVVIILFSSLNIQRMRRDMTTMNTVVSDAVIALSLFGLVTSIIEIIGEVLQLIGLIEAETLRAIVTWLAVNCPMISIVIAGFILVNHDYQLMSIMMEYYKSHSMKKKTQ